MGDFTGTSVTTAAFMRPKEGGEKARVNVTGSTIKIKTVNNGPKQRGGDKTEALFIDGDAIVNGENAEVVLDARNGAEDLERCKLIAELSKVLDTLSPEKLMEFAGELEDPHGVSAMSDLKHMSDEELNSLKTLKGVQKRKFLRHVRNLNGRC